MSAYRIWKPGISILWAFLWDLVSIIPGVFVLVWFRQHAVMVVVGVVMGWLWGGYGVVMCLLGLWQLFCSIIFQGTILKYYGSKYSIITIYIITFAPLAYYVILNGLNILSANSYMAACNLNIGLLNYICRIFLRSCFLTLPAGMFLIFAFAFNDSILAMHVGGMERSLGILIADKQVAALEIQHFAAVALMFLITFLSLLTVIIIMTRGGKSAYHRN